MMGVVQVDITGCSAVGTESLRELRRFSLRVLRLARIWQFEVRGMMITGRCCH